MISAAVASDIHLTSSGDFLFPVGNQSFLTPFKADRKMEEGYRREWLALVWAIWFRGRRFRGNLLSSFGNEPFGEDTRMLRLRVIPFPRKPARGLWVLDRAVKEKHPCESTIGFVSLRVLLCALEGSHHGKCWSPCFDTYHNGYVSKWGFGLPRCLVFPIGSFRPTLKRGTLSLSLPLTWPWQVVPPRGN